MSAWSWSDVEGGRPATGSTAPKKDTRISVALSAEDFAALEALAAARDESRAETARALIVAVLEEERAAERDAP